MVLDYFKKENKLFFVCLNLENKYRKLKKYVYIILKNNAPNSLQISKVRKIYFKKYKKFIFKKKNYY